MHTRRRDAFTLIELLVVMGILMFLFGLGVAILPAVYQRWETTKGAEMVQGTFARARQEARRSGKPTGVRMAIQPGNIVIDLKFIQQPLDGTTPGLAQAGEYIIPDGAGLPMKPPGAIVPNMNYRVVRLPQIIPGESVVKLPNNVCLDMTRTSTNGTTAAALPVSGVEPAPSNASYSDILFSPGGGLSSANWGTDKVILWVRDQTLLDPTKGSPTLIVIYVRTGLIAAHPVDITGAPNLTNPYTFANDPRTSGL